MTPKDILAAVEKSTGSVTCNRPTIDASDAECAFEIQKRELIIREKDQLLEEHHEEHELRKTYIRSTFVFVAGVTFISLFVTVSTGLRWVKLSDTVLVTLLTTTIANVLGCLFIAFHWLFPRRSESGSEDNTDK